jgi:hypothetical protein
MEIQNSWDDRVQQTVVSQRIISSLLFCSLCRTLNRVDTAAICPVHFKQNANGTQKMETLRVNIIHNSHKGTISRA